MFREAEMRDARRTFLKSSGGLLAAAATLGLIGPEEAIAEEWNKAAFETKKMEDLVHVMGGSSAQQSAELSLVAPDIAENGAVVPIGVVSKLPGTEAIAILVEKNPNVLAAAFSIPQGTLPDVQTRVKMAQTSNVFALVKAGGRFYYAAKEIKITLGGCGG
jgi:sulfur-oxidizing protein SoxY